MRRRASDDMSADEVEQFFGSLPGVIRELRAGKRVNRFLVLFTIVAFLTVSYRTEVQQDQRDADARHDRATAYKQCRLVNDNARALNGLIDTVILRVRVSDLSDAEKNQAVALYESSKQALPVCEAP